MSDLVGSFVQGGFNLLSNDIAFQQQKELQRDAQDYNRMMFNMSNMYNSPLAQMSRFKNAGLNPNLIYGQQANTASPIGMSSSSAPSAANMQAPSLLETAQIGLIDAQRKNIEADTKLKESNVGLNDATIEKYGHENNWTDQQIEQSKAEVNKIDEEIHTMKLNRNKIKKEIKLLQAQRDLTEWQAVQAMVDAIWADERNKAIVDNLVAQTNLTNAQAKEIYTLMYAKLANINADTRLKNAEATTSVVLRNLYRSQTEGQDISNSQAVERFNKEMQLLDQSISTGSIQSELSEDFPGTMKFVSVLGQVIGAFAPLFMPAAVVYGSKQVTTAPGFRPKRPRDSTGRLKMFE